MGNLTAEQLRLVVSYDPETGVFTQRNDAGRHARWKAGRPMGHVAATGYLTIRLVKRLHQAHRLAWLYVHGAWPSKDIDHRNGDRLDNRIDNLRDVSNETNRQNTKLARSDSSTQIQGVHFSASRGVYSANVRHRGRCYFLGYHETAEAARAAYVSAKSRLHDGWVQPACEPKDETVVSWLGAGCPRRIRRDSATGILGISKLGDGWRARYKKKHIGVFSTIDQARAAIARAQGVAL
jgi:hypothetical protein